MAQSVAEIRSRITATLDQVVLDSGRQPQAWSDDQTLLGDMGLDSLELAVLVVQLERDLGVDPFRQGAQGVRTLGDLTSCYAGALGL